MFKRSVLNLPPDCKIDIITSLIHHSLIEKLIMLFVQARRPATIPMAVCWLGFDSALSHFQMHKVFKFINARCEYYKPF